MHAKFQSDIDIVFSALEWNSNRLFVDAMNLASTPVREEQRAHSYCNIIVHNTRSEHENNSHAKEKDTYSSERFSSEHDWMKEHQSAADHLQ
jgi:hypothetical protein